MNTKKLKLPHGIPGHNLGEIEREVPASEPNAWPINEKLKYVGKPVKRYDAVAKVTGQAKFTADMRLPGMLYAKFFRSNCPNALIKDINTQKAKSLPGVYGIHILKDDKGNYPEIKFAGQPILAVAATSLEIAEDAVGMIQVDYSYKDFVIDLEDAQKPDSHIVHEQAVEAKEDAGDVGVSHDGSKSNGNVVGPSTSSFYGGPRGELEKGFKEADVVVEHIYKTQVHTHVPLETHGVVVDWKPGNMTVYASTQNTKNFRSELADYFDISDSEVRVISEFTGGGFGAKHSAGSFGPMASHVNGSIGVKCANLSEI